MPKKASARAAKKKQAQRAKKQRAAARRNVDAAGEARAKKQRQRERTQRRQQRTKAPRREEAPDLDFDGNPNEIDIRIGEVLTVEVHPRADKLLVETINVGDVTGQPRTICSGLRGKIALEELQGARVLVMCNLRKRNMLGVDSFGMVMVGHTHSAHGSDDDDSDDEVCSLPEIAEDCYVGERIVFDGCEERPVLSCVKARRLKKFLPFFRSGDDRMCCYKEFTMRGQYTNGRVLTKTPNESVS